jgi:hypothetical protein
MQLKRFNQFFTLLSEAQTVELPILDIVIDDNGVPHNGSEADLVKGRVKRLSRGNVEYILGTDNKRYPAGIDKNGNVTALIVDDEGRALQSDGKTPIQIPDYVRTAYKIKADGYYVGDEWDYYSLVPIEPTGWVNVKIDMEIVKRVKRYARSLGTNNRGHQSFLDKLTEFQKFSSQSRSPQYIQRLKRATIQKEMSCILLLHHINEIKDFFNPSQSGFLFESFVGGLIPNSRIKEDNSPVDIKTTVGDRYQLKFVDWKTDYVEITKDIDPSRSSYLEHYMIALKHVEKIELLIIDGAELERRIEGNTIGDLITKGESRTKDKVTGKPLYIKPKFAVNRISALNDDGLVKKFTIELTDIDGRISNLGESLKASLNELYKELSVFQYNVETIITGVNEKGKPIRDIGEFDVYHLSAEQNIKNLSDHLNRLVQDIRK